MNCFIDYRTSDEEINILQNLNINTIKVPRSSLVYPAIDGHVDIQLNILTNSSNHIIVHKNICTDFIETLDSLNISHIQSANSLSDKYPGNISLNALITKTHFIHNTKYTDPNLLSSQSNKKIINVSQGYTKCSVLPISDTAFITSDLGICKSLIHEGFDVLLIPPGDISLPSLDYGFIGGTGGMISSNTLALFGDLNSFKYGDEVKSFLYKHEIEYISLRKGKLIDRGSLLCV